MKPHPPISSPEPGLDPLDSHPSGSHNIATIREAVIIADAAAEATAAYVAKREAKKEVTRIVTSADVKWFVATMAGVAVATVATIGWANGAIDGGVAKAIVPIEQRQVRTEARLDKIEPALQQLSLEQARTSVGVDMLLRERGIRPPPPVPPVSSDGGR